MTLTGVVPSSYTSLENLEELHLETIQGLTSTMPDWQKFFSSLQ
jgi:hypothetical protein